MNMEVPNPEVPHSGCHVKDKIVSEDSLENMKSPEYQNYYDNKFHILDEQKIEVPDTEVPHSDCNVKDEIVSEDKELSKFNNQNETKHETVENRLPLNVTIKTENIEEGEGEILENNKYMSVAYELPIQYVPLNSDKSLLKNKHKKPPKVAEVIFKCINCSAEFNNKLSLNDHSKLCQKLKKTSTYNCVSCNGVYKSKERLKNHVRRRHANNQYKCKCCGTVFNTKHTLMVHMECIHYDYGRTFDCPCGKQFRTPLNLRRHKLRQHEQSIKDTDNDIFQCDSCQEVFENTQSLVTHINSSHYDSERIFACRCGKQYRSPVHVYKHKAQCHTHNINDTDYYKYRFQCESCQRKFKKKRSLFMHVKRFHYDYEKSLDC